MCIGNKPLEIGNLKVYPFCLQRFLQQFQIAQSPVFRCSCQLLDRRQSHFRLRLKKIPDKGFRCLIRIISCECLDTPHTGNAGIIVFRQYFVPQIGEIRGAHTHGVQPRQHSLNAIPNGPFKRSGRDPCRKIGKISNRRGPGFFTTANSEQNTFTVTGKGKIRPDIAFPYSGQTMTHPPLGIFLQWFRLPPQTPPIGRKKQRHRIYRNVHPLAQCLGSVILQLCDTLTTDSYFHIGKSQPFKGGRLKRRQPFPLEFKLFTHDLAPATA